MKKNCNQIICNEHRNLAAKCARKIKKEFCLQPRNKLGRHLRLLAFESKLTLPGVKRKTTLLFPPAPRRHTLGSQILHRPSLQDSSRTPHSYKIFRHYIRHPVHSQTTYTRRRALCLDTLGKLQQTNLEIIQIIMVIGAEGC